MHSSRQRNENNGTLEISESASIVLPRSRFGRTLTTTALLIAVLLIVQCTTSDPNSNDTSITATANISPTAAPTPTSTPGPTATPFATPTAIPAISTVTPPDDLQRGGVLRFAIPEGPPHSDPHLTASSSLASWGAGLAY